MVSTMKYTKEVLAPLVAQSHSLAGVLRLLGLKFSGGSQSHIKNRIASLGIDSSHFTGQGSHRGLAHKRPNKVPAEQVLTYGRCSKGSRREDGYRLRRALLESGVLEACALCSIGPVWQEKPMRLQVDHLNGDWADNRAGNLRFLCPNCHSQTETFGTKNSRLRVRA